MPIKFLFFFMGLAVAIPGFARTPEENVEFAKTGLASLAVALENSPTSQILEQIFKAETRLQNAKMFAEARALHELTKTQNRRLVADRARALIADSSQNGILVLIDMLNVLIQGMPVFWVAACEQTPGDEKKVSCAIYWTLAILTLDGEAVGLQ